MHTHIKDRLHECTFASLVGCLCCSSWLGFSSQIKTEERRILANTNSLVQKKKCTPPSVGLLCGVTDGAKLSEDVLRAAESIMVQTQFYLIMGWSCIQHQITTTEDVGQLYTAWTQRIHIRKNSSQMYWITEKHSIVQEISCSYQITTYGWGESKKHHICTFWSSCSGSE